MKWKELIKSGTPAIVECKEREERKKLGAMREGRLKERLSWSGTMNGIDIFQFNS